MFKPKPCADDLNPIAEEVDEHRHQRARVQRDIEGQARRPSNRRATG